ncbi:coiled-coil domain-containing protein 151 [Pseudorasbora parva]|uniref:coiled-coil domain-containing protein 151 n=1 Tax=Pseudorasbora parva TaxID=51549 RepID=UPI00351DD9E2
MPGTYVSGGIKHPIHDKMSELQRKIQLLEGDRSAYFESSQSAIKKNRETILQLRQENKNLYKKQAEGDEQAIKDVFQGRGIEKASFRNMSVKSAQTVLQKEVCDKMKKLNAMKHTTETQRQRSEDLKLQNQSMKPQNRSPLPDNEKQEVAEKKMRILENRLEKTQLKYHEAEHIMRGYLKLKEHLQEDSLTFQPKLDSMEAEINRQTQVLKELQVMNSDAHMSKDAAKAELQLQEEQVYRERRERDKILSRYKKQAVERMAQAERMKRRPQWAAMHPDELSSEAQHSANGVGEEVEATSTFEKAFQSIKDATGVTDSREIVDRFISQRETQEHLEKMKAENEKMLLQLKEARNTLKTELQEMKYSRETEHSSNQQTLQDCERHLQQEQQRRDAVKDSLERLTHTLNAVKAGVQQLSDKLQHLPLKGPTPQLPADSEEHVLLLMSEVEQKEMLLKEEIHGKDLASTLKEMDEEEFPSRIAGKLPQYNMRIQLHKAQKQDSFDDEDDSGDEGDIITRVTLKHQSQSIIDANTKRKTRIKKRKGKL